MRLDTGTGPVDVFAIRGLGDVERLPHTVRILLENLLRRAGSRDVSDEDVRALAAWPERSPTADLAFMPARVLMQDFTGVPAVVDLAAIRSAVARAGGDPSKVNPLVDVDLVIDHSVQVDLFRSPEAYEANIEWEYRRNGERYALLRWAQQAFERCARGAAGGRDLPPGEPRAPRVGGHGARRGRVPRHARRHRLAHDDDQRARRPRLGGRRHRGRGGDARPADVPPAARRRRRPRARRASRRDDRHRPRADAHPDAPRARRRRQVRRVLRRRVSTLELADRATLSNMCPEYGATSALFPVDDETLRYLRSTGRGDRVDLVERYAKEQGLFRRDGDPEPMFSELSIWTCRWSSPPWPGPKRPQDRVRAAGRVGLVRRGLPRPARARSRADRRRPPPG